MVKELNQTDHDSDNGSDSNGCNESVNDKYCVNSSDEVDYYITSHCNYGIVYYLITYKCYVD